MRPRATPPHFATFPQIPLIEPTHRRPFGEAATAKGPSKRSTPSPRQTVLHAAEQCPALVRIYLQVAPPGWPSARPAGVSEPVPIEQVAPAAFACVAVPAQPVADPTNVSVTPDEPVGAA